MPTEIIEGTAHALDIEASALPQRSLTVAQPGQAIVSKVDDGPDAMIAVASRLAVALKDIVERQRLYTIINGRKFPQVEAWMTIGRLDNVVAREAERPIRNDDGSYEGFVELVRLSDGMVIGRASALCGTEDDAPWGGIPAKNGRSAVPPRSEPARRSMAVTRATSRAFRQQYSWIMALAGYEPTPAEEMQDQRPVGAHDTPPDRPELDRPANGLIGEVQIGKPPVDMQVRQTPEGPAYGFKLKAGNKGYQALAVGPFAEALSLAGLTVGERVEVDGSVVMVPWDKDGKPMPPFARIALTRVSTSEWVLPAPSDAHNGSGGISEAEAAEIVARELAEATA